jgi:hypothetical protein
MQKSKFNYASLKLSAAVSVVLGLAGGAAPNVVWAADASADAGLEEVVVTAQRREQNSQDVGVSLTALSNKDLRKLGITDSTDPNFAGKVFSQPNSSSFVKNRGGLLAFQGIFMNADGSGITSPAPATFFGVRKPDGTVLTLCRETDPVVGLPAGWVYSSMNGSTSPCISDAGVVVFSANIANATLSESGNAIMAWDAINGLRVLAKASSSNVSPFSPTGDTNFTGTPISQITLIGSTGNNGDGGHTGLSSNGWLTLRAADTGNSIYTIARIFLGSTANACPSDLNQDGSVNASDLATLLGAWGTGGADINGDGTTNASDLAALLGAWGACPN